MLEKRAKISVLGVVPYMYMDIDDEDSLSERFSKTKTKGLVDIVVIRLPRISNFTDFNAFECVDDVSLRYVTNPNEIGNPDIIIIPGTKNTISDLFWLRQNGFDIKVQQCAKEGKIIFGVCGGYQILGETICDPEGIECKGTIKGLGLLPINTVFKSKKTRTRVTGRFKKIEGRLKDLSYKSFEGYEIHMGFSEIIDNSNAMSELKESRNIQKEDGLCKGNVYGTYVHGIFDKEIIVKTIISAILEEKGISTDKIKAFDMKKYKEKQYDMLAEQIRNSVDMGAIYEIVNKGIR